MFTAISPQNYGALRLPPNVTGIITEFNLDKTLALAERLQPEASRLFVIAGSGEVDRRWQSAARKTIEGRDRKFEVTYLFERSYANLVEEVSKIPRDFDPCDAADGICRQRRQRLCPGSRGGCSPSAISPAPLYAPYDTYIGNGSVGGFVETFELVGIRAADMALQILAGKDPATIAPQTNPGQAYRVDHRAMARWKLQESKLPPDTTVLFKEPTIWTEHRALSVAAILICALAIVDRWRTAGSAAEKVARRESAQGKRRADDVRRRRCQYWALAI